MSCCNSAQLFSGKSLSAAQPAQEKCPEKEKNDVKDQDLKHLPLFLESLGWSHSVKVQLVCHRPSQAPPNIRSQS